MSFSQGFHRDSNIVYLSQVASSFGSAFSKYAIPLFIYHSTGNVYHIGLQWALIAIVNLLAGYITPYINFFKNDKDALIKTDLMLAFCAAIPLFTLNYYPIIGAYIATGTISFLATIQNSFFEGFVSFTAELEDDTHNARTFLLAKKANGKHTGTLIGFSLAYIISTNLGFVFAFIVDSATFLASAIINLRITKSGHTGKNTSTASYSLLFVSNLKFLSFAQIFAGFSVYLVNATWLVSIKKTFMAPDIAISMIMIAQYIFSYCASLYVTKLAKENKSFSSFQLFFIRSLYILIFLLLANATHYYHFIVLLTCFNFLIPLSLPGITALFHQSVQSHQVKALAGARTGITMMAGALGAILGSFLLDRSSFTSIYLIIAILFSLSSLFFLIYIKKQLVHNIK